METHIKIKQAALDPVLSSAQVAEALNISISTLYRLQRAGKGPPRFRVALQNWGYLSSKLLAWREQREEQAQQ